MFFDQQEIGSIDWPGSICRRGRQFVVLVGLCPPHTL